MRAKTDYIVPAARLNYYEPKAPDNYKGLAHFDDTYPIPCDWIVANAARFYVTTQQILEAALPDFIDPEPGRRCRLWAVYFLIRGGEIVYVGQSSCLESRLVQHRENGKAFDAVAWMEVPALFIDSIEAFYIWRCNPIYNNKWPGDGEFGQAARALDEKHGEKRNDAVYVTTLSADSTWVKVKEKAPAD